MLMSHRSVSCRLWFALRKPLLLLASTLVALALGEMMVRALGLAPRVYPLWTAGEHTAFQRSTNPLLGYEYKPSFRSDHPATAEAAVVFASINSDGLRDIEREVAKPSGTRRIVLLGDSVVSGHGTPDLDHTISRRLEARFNDPRVEVLNVSVCGYNTRAEVELLQSKGLKYEPDLVVLVFTGNDYENSNAGGDVARYGGTMSGHRALMSLCIHSDLARTAAVRLGLIRLGDTIDVYRWHADAMGTNNVVDGLQMLEQLAKEHGFQVVVAVWPGFEPGRIIEWSDYTVGGIDESETIARLAPAHGFSLIRLAPYFQQHLSEVGLDVDPAEYFTTGDRMHPSVVGANVAAQALLPICRELLERPSSVRANRSSQSAAEGEGLQVKSLATLADPSGVAVCPGRDEVYVADQGSGRVVRIDPRQPHESVPIVTGLPTSSGSPSDATRWTANTGIGFAGRSAMWVTGRRSGGRTLAEIVSAGRRVGIAIDGGLDLRSSRPASWSTFSVQRAVV